MSCLRHHPITHRSTIRTESERGIALLAVLILLGILLTMLGPFMMSMGQAGNDAYDEANVREADILVDAARRTLVQRVGQTQGQADLTPGYDGLDEFPPRLELVDEGEQSPLGNRRQVSGEIVDLQGRIHAPTAPVEVWSNLFGLAAKLDDDLEAAEEDLIVAGGTSNFPDEDGFIWIDQELIRYRKKTQEGFEGLERGYKWAGAGSAPDPYGPPRPHTRGTRIVDARMRLLVTAQFDEGHDDRGQFVPWNSVSELRGIEKFERGALDATRIDSIRDLLTFDAARPTGGSLAKSERVFNSLMPGETASLSIRDPASLIAGSIVRIRSGDEYEWALVVGVTRRGGRRTTVSGSMWNVFLHRATQLESAEGEAFVEALTPVPINVNTAPVQVLTPLLTGIRQQNGAGGRGDHAPLRTPLSRSKAQALAQQIVTLRGGEVGIAADEATDPNVRPFRSFEDIARRVLFPAVERDQLITQQELQYIYTALMHGSQTKLDQATIPICFESAGLVHYRVAGAVYSGVGRTLAARERTGVAFPQPDRAVDRYVTSQNDFDELTRLTRSRVYWQTGPRNTTVRLDPFNEPPDLSIAHMFSYLHGKAPRFPDPDPGSGTARLAVARAPQFGGGNTTYGFEAAEHPEGRDIAKEGPFEDVRAFVAAAKSGAKKKVTSDARSRVIPMYVGEGGLGINFGISFWMRPNDLGNQMLFDLANRDRQGYRNRIFAALEGDDLVLRLFDVAGLDPDPGRRNPTETAVQWRVPIAENGIAANLWTHVGIEVCGGGPDGVVLFTDGAAKGGARYMSHLGIDIPEMTLGGNSTPFDKARAAPIQIEDAEGLPPEGVYIVGGEIIETVDIAGNTLITARKDSRGGRLARQDALEYAQNGGNTGGGAGTTPTITIPPHPRNAGIRLYGYSNPIAENALVIPGEGSLGNALEPWGVARVIEPDKSVPFARISPGKGMDDKFLGEIRLVAPAVGAKTGGDGVPGFDPGGGYAVLLQTHITAGPQAFEPDELGGIEVIKYEGFDGERLRITERAVQLDPDLKAPGPNGLIARTPRKFITEWERGLWQTKEDPNDLPQLWTFCVPISMSVGGLTLVDPSGKQHSEWVQVRSPGSEADLEWVRYDWYDASKAWIVRSRLQAILRLHRALIRSPRRVADVRRQGNRTIIIWETIDGPPEYLKPPKISPEEIGHPDDFEIGDNLPHYEARRALGFRGDPSVGTSSHAQGANAVITPVFRSFLGSVKNGRPGRGDRVALVTGTSTSGNASSVEWNTVTWCARNWENFDPNAAGRPPSEPPGPSRPGQGAATAPDSRGPRANLVALERGTTIGYIGKKFEFDSRAFDRLVKFPSGELPTRLTDPVIGGSRAKDLPDFGGIVDDIQGYSGLAYDQQSWGDDAQIVGVVGVPCLEADGVINLIPSRGQVQGTGALNGGGLVLVEGEVIGFRSFDASEGRLTVATNGRGMLGTEPRAHDRGARVQFLSSRPATALPSAVPASLAGVMVENPAKVARNAGTILIDQELIHYGWQRGPLLEGPKHEKRNAGLFRGRYGTTPAQHDAGALAIHWPIRYWDRWAAEADDPEMSWLTFSFEAPNLYVTEVTWKEQIPDALLDLKLLVRADARSPWTETPAGYPLWLFDDPVDPTNASGRASRKILAQASRWDFRFAVEYKPGAFDAQTFRATAWKRTPTLESFGWSYQAATSILEERETLR